MAEFAVETATRERILQVALEEFGRVGYSRTSIRTIAAGAGVTHAALYRHFDSKLAIFAELVNLRLRREAPRLVEEVNEIEDPRLAIKTFGERYLELLRTDPEMRLFTRAMLIDRDLIEGVRRAESARGVAPLGIARLLEDLFARLARTGAIPDSRSPKEEAALFLNMVNGIAYVQLFEGPIVGPLPIAEESQLIDRILHGCLRE